MVFSIWRLCHLTIAIFSFLFIFLASITGIILSIEPITEKLHPYSAGNLKEISIANTITVLKKNCSEIISIEKDQNDFISASVITDSGSNEKFYIDPRSGKKIGAMIQQAPLYKFAAKLHRSLFLKTTGRLIVGVVSFLLLSIAITGFILITRRQGGITRIFSKVVKDDFYQYYHVVLGRLSLIPIIIISGTGMYLSLERFSVFPKEIPSKASAFSTKYDEKQKKNPVDFAVFQNTPLKSLKILEFPFSIDIEDPFYLKLKDKEMIIHQYSGVVLNTKKYPFLVLASSFSSLFHTGRGSILWSLILLLSTTSILFFIYSGFVIAIRRKKRAVPINDLNPINAEYVILVGSETGNTFELASLLFDALKKAHKKVFITDLNKYTLFTNLKHLLILTATYGKGEAPANGNQFHRKIKNFQPTHKVQFSVIGFGSLAYPDFCQFASDTDQLLQEKTNFEQTIPLHKVHNQNFDDFLKWATAWTEKTKIPILLEAKKETLRDVMPFEVIERTALNKDGTFLIRVKPPKNLRCQSGDLLKIFPEKDNAARYYSIGSYRNHLLFSVKKHPLGICSSYLSQMKIGSIFSGSLKSNQKFHFPKKSKEVILISNGTGIAPFLGMIHENIAKVKTHLFWGGRDSSSFDLYRNFVEESLEKRHLCSIHLTYSREIKEKKYVQHMIRENSDFIAQVLLKKGVIMICGSLAMESAVKSTINFIAKSKLNLGIQELSDQIKSDCY